MKWDNFYKKGKDWFDEAYDQRKGPLEDAIEIVKNYIRKRFVKLPKLIDKAISSAE